LSFLNAEMTGAGTKKKTKETAETRKGMDLRTGNRKETEDAVAKRELKLPGKKPAGRKKTKELSYTS